MTSTVRPSVLAALFVSCVLVSALAIAAQRPSGPQGESYASMATLPDWSGVWVRPFAEFAAENASERDPASGVGPRLTPAVAAQRAASRERVSARADTAADPAIRGTSCSVPGGMPHIMRFPFGIEFLFTPGRVTMLLETGPMVRRIYTDGRPHRVDPDATYAGESIGHWEGDTLVVDTVAITPLAAVTNGVTGSGKTRITERIRRVDPTHIRIDTVVQDPEVLQTPWRYSRMYERSDAGHFERYCDNNRDGNDTEPDLTPPPAGVL